MSIDITNKCSNVSLGIGSTFLFGAAVKASAAYAADQLVKDVDGLKHDLSALNQTLSTLQGKLSILEERVNKIENPTHNFYLFDLSLIVTVLIVAYLLWRYFRFGYETKKLLSNHK